MTRTTPLSSDAAQRSAEVIPLRFPESDVALVKALVGREPAAGAILFDRYAPHVRRVLARVMGPDAELPDLLQDVFVVALASIDRLAEPSALKAWLTQTAVFTARARIRRRSRWRFLRFVPADELPDVPVPELDVEGNQAVSAVYRVLNALPVNERIALALRVFEGMELTAVAAACGVSLATIKRRLARAQQRFAILARREPTLLQWLERGAP